MSTRATYKFISNRHNTDTTLYIHHDGYPSGAAYYFSKGTDVESFIRNNERAEIIQNHEAHADTEYRYTQITGDGFASEVFTVHNKSDLGIWNLIYSGTLKEFIKLEGNI
tara:strand:+ start:319 stop:648 length:330 start_codon:yes stop_codon:yes gene_type:complete